MIDRRTLLSTLAALAASTAARAAGPAGLFGPGGHALGIQMYMLGPLPQQDLDGTLAALAAIGYREIELLSFYGRTPAELGEAARRHGLAIPSVHLLAGPFAFPKMLTLEAEPGRIAEALRQIGADNAVLTLPLLIQPPHPRPGETQGAALARVVAEDPDVWKRTADFLNAKGAALRGEGVALGYHNHNMEFAPVKGTTGLELLLAATDPRDVALEADIGWVAAAGLDPVAFIRRHAARIRQMHLKDIKASTRPNFVLAQDSAIVGQGVLDWPAVLAAARAAGIEHYYVEQEPPFATSRLDAARKSYAFLSGQA